MIRPDAGNNYATMSPEVAYEVIIGSGQLFAQGATFDVPDVMPYDKVMEMVSDFRFDAVNDNPAGETNPDAIVSIPLLQDETTVWLLRRSLHEKRLRQERVRQSNIFAQYGPGLCPPPDPPA